MTRNIKPRRSAFLVATAYHEAGHAVAAWRSGIAVRSVSIECTIGALGNTRHHNPLRGRAVEYDLSDRMRLKYERAIIIALAGPAAQKHFAPRSWREHHGHEDHEYAAELTFRIAGSGNVAKAFRKWLELATVELIEANWEHVKALAEELVRKKCLNKIETLAAIEQPITERLKNDIGLQWALRDVNNLGNKDHS